MERLQVAVQEARERRARLTEADPRTRTPALGPEPETPVSPWDKLSSVTPPRRRLLRGRIFLNARAPGGVAIDLLRTRLLKLMASNGWKRVMITSPNSGCGKTNVCANLAMALSRRPEGRAVLIDLDVFRPSLAGTLGLNPTAGVADVLTGRVAPSDQMVSIGGNLAVCASRSAHPEDANVLKTRKAREVLDEIERDFAPDIMLFDAPPFFGTDAVIAASDMVDCVVIVGASGESSIDQLDRTESDLSQYTNIAGIVLNKCRYLAGDSDAAYPQ
ncbi:CpsD/CapB family tyrosine-protein kinase [Roseivivax marinus]|uniref:CpsD/CapB family tyrosine-protein kinase n=1 Tax=Roseivivax marinus TaxID=1379903 RepID=UPI00273E33CB|nr:CpsD/CapB family tyrosine-protein kinase [Roseivivax marinus]